MSDITMGIIFIAIGLLGALYQRFFTPGGWLSCKQFWNHEILIAVLIAFGSGWIVGSIL
jgi:hypothetical protein